MDNPESKISGESAQELRRLIHDLNNALETILQASYLVAQSEIPESSRRWLAMIDKGAQDAARIGREMRERLRTDGKL